MRLEDQHGALVVELLHRVEQDLQLAGMVGIVVIHVRAVILALELEAAARAVEARKAENMTLTTARAYYSPKVNGMYR